MSFPCREQGVSVPAETKGAPAETKGYTLRCSGDLLCGYLRGCRGEEEKPELERVDRLPVSAGNFRRALQRHFLVDFQTEDIAGKIFSCSKRAYFALVNRARNGWTAFARSLPTHRFHDWSKTEAALQRQRHCSVICQSIFKTKMSLERSFPALNEHVLRLWIERETAEQRPLEVCRRIDFATEAALKFNLLTGYPKYERHALHSRHWLGESMKRSAEV